MAVTQVCVRLWCSGNTEASQASNEGSIPFSRFGLPAMAFQCSGIVILSGSYEPEVLSMGLSAAAEE